MRTGISRTALAAEFPENLVDLPSNPAALLPLLQFLGRRSALLDRREAASVKRLLALLRELLSACGSGSDEPDGIAGGGARSRVAGDLTATRRQSR